MNKKAFILTLSFLVSGVTSCGNNIEVVRNEPMLNKAVWVWNETNDGYTAQVKIPYSKDDYEIIDAEVSKEIVQERSCLEGGIDRYVAKATYYGVLLESKKDVSVEPKGHVYDEYYATESMHYEKCKCGDIKEGHAHTFGGETIIEESDGWKNPGLVKKVCNICKYEKIYNLLPDNDYTKLKLDHLKELLNSITEELDINFIYRYSGVINEIKEVFDLLNYEEVNQLELSTKSKLLSVLFDFETALDSRVHNSYSLYDMVNFISTIGKVNYGVIDPVYGDVCELSLNRDWDNYEYSLSYDNPYPSLAINNPPTVTTGTKKLVFFIYAPQTGVSINFKYFALNDSNVDRTNLFARNIDLTKGWNTIEISGAELGTFLLKNIRKLRLDFISSKGLTKTVGDETWKISSMYSANEPIGNIIEKIAALPSSASARAYDFLNVRSLLTRYTQLPSVCKKIIDKDGNVEKLYDSISNYVSLPYGDSYDIKINWNTSHKVSPVVDTQEIGPAFKIDVAFDVTNGSYQHAIGNMYKTSRQTAVFYTKDYVGDLGVEYQGPGEGTYSKLCELQKVKLSNGCYAHYVTIEDYAKFNNLVLTNCESKLCVKLRGTVKASTSIYLSPILHVDIKSFDVDDALAMLPNTVPTSLTTDQRSILDGVKFLYDATLEKDLVLNQDKLNAYFEKFITE